MLPRIPKCKKSATCLVEKIKSALDKLGKAFKYSVIVMSSMFINQQYGTLRKRKESCQSVHEATPENA